MYRGDYCRTTRVPNTVITESAVRGRLTARMGPTGGDFAFGTISRGRHDFP